MLLPRKTFPLLLCLSLLGACATPTPETTPASEEGEVAEESGPEPEGLETPGPGGQVESKEEEETPPLLSDQDLLGLEPADIQAILGPVSLKRWEGDVQVMQFANGHCVLDIYFYESAPGEAFEASYITSRMSSGESIDNQRCLALLKSGAEPEEAASGQ